MRRFSILGLMGLILFAAVAFAGLKGADDNWAAALQFLTLAVLGMAVLGVIHGRGKTRAACLGFALFGGCYHLLAAGPWISDQARPKLPTTMVLDAAHQRLFPAASPVISFQTYLTPNTATGPQTSLGVNWTLPNTIQSLPPNAPQWDYVVAAPAVPVTWTALTPLPIPLTGNPEPFQRVGHSLFACLIGAIGAIISRRMSRNEAVALQSVWSD